MKNIIKKLVLREKYNSDTYISYLRKKGVTIGEDCTIYAPSKTFVDIQYPWMVQIGDHVRITQGVIILAHDYAWSVLKRDKNLEGGGGILGASGEVTIGNNVFIGMNSIILRGVHIGDNVVIGAGSVVSKDCAENGVYAGNPAKFIMSINDYYEKRKNAQVKEACLLAKQYKEKFHSLPSKEVFHEYFMLFTSLEELSKNEAFSGKAQLCCNYDDSVAYMNNHKPVFSSFDEFLQYCYSTNVN